MRKRKLRSVLIIICALVYPTYGFSKSLKNAEFGCTILDSNQYIYAVEGCPYTYIMRSMTLQLECEGESLYFDFSRLGNGSIMHGPLAVDSNIFYAERESSNDECIKNEKCIAAPRFAFPMVKILEPGDKFTVNICYPDVVDCETIIQLIICAKANEPWLHIKELKNDMIKSDSITLPILPFLQSYASYVYNLYAKDRWNFFDDNLIPYPLSDKCMDKKPYIVNSAMLKKASYEYSSGNKHYLEVEYGPLLQILSEKRNPTLPTEKTKYACADTSI